MRGTSGAAGYDLSAAQSAVVQAHGKCLVKPRLAMAIPAGLLWENRTSVGVSMEKVY